MESLWGKGSSSCRKWAGRRQPAQTGSVAAAVAAAATAAGGRRLAWGHHCGCLSLLLHVPQAVAQQPLTGAQPEGVVIQLIIAPYVGLHGGSGGGRGRGRGRHCREVRRSRSKTLMHLREGRTCIAWGAAVQEMFSRSCQGEVRQRHAAGSAGPARASQGPARRPASASHQPPVSHHLLHCMAQVALTAFAEEVPKGTEP